MKACTSSSFGVPYGSLWAGIETFAVHHQSTGRGVSGSSEISQSLTSVLGNRVWLGLQPRASDGCSHRRECLTFPHTHILQLLSEKSCGILNRNNAAAEEAFKEPITKESELRHILYLLQSLSVLQTQDWCFHFHGQSPVGRQSPLGHYTPWNKAV